MQQRFTTRDMNEASVAAALGYAVIVERAPASRRCLYCLPDTPVLRDLLERFQRGAHLDLSTKAVLQARTTLYHESLRAQMEAS